MISIIFRLTLLAILLKSSNQVRECGIYGSPPCTYVPSPPGVTPTCAAPGKTYCEVVKHYPTHVIRHLIHKWGYEANNLIVDETTEEFEATRFAQTNRFFHSPYFSNQNAFNFDDGYSYPKPQRPFLPEGGSNAYIANSDPIYIRRPSNSIRRPNSLIANRDYTSNGVNIFNKPVTHYTHKVYVTEYNPAHWLKRFSRDVSKKEMFSYEDFDFTSTESPSNDTDVKLNEIERDDPIQIKASRKLRVRRQSPGRQGLCQTNSQFIIPKAALNSQGNWRYVVNMVDTSRQLVRVETCASSVCSNLCQLPNGYNSRCEQKFVQKRLIALNGDGQDLYTDTFWFPSCCACTITNQ